MSQVFTDSELGAYEAELDRLCAFQHCYGACQREVVQGSCTEPQATAALDLVRSYVQWHAADIYDWHVLSENGDKLPASCARLTGFNPEEDPILRIMANMP